MSPEEMYLSGMSLPQIALATGSSISTTRRRLISSGVKMRTIRDGVRLAISDGRLKPPTPSAFCSLSARMKLREKALARGETTAKGVSLKPSGYIEITRGKDKGRGEHRVVAERHIGRRLKKGECVHHIDGDRSNNHPSNLRVMTISDHNHLHRLAEPPRPRGKNGRFV